MVKTFCTLITLTFLVALLETNVNSFFLGARGFSASAAGRCRFVLGTTKGDGDDINDSAQQQQQHFERRRVVIVGGGVGGMAIASRIASSLPDIKISILEKNEKIGGRCGSFDVEVPGVRGGTFRHERGPSLLLLPDIYRELFEECCASSRDLNSAEAFGLNIMPCVPAYQVVFDDGDRIEVGFPRNRENSTLTDAETKSRSAMDSFEVNGSGKWDEYMKACEAFLDCGLPNFIEERIDVTTLPAFLREALRDSCKAWPLKSHSEVLDAIFSSNKMKALASFQDLYVGLEPYRNDQKFGGGVLQSTAPAVFGLLAAIELHPTNKKCGVFAPEGGFRQVSNSFEKLVRHLGVEVSCGRMVTSITDAGVYHCAADDDGGSSTTLFEPADLVVVNADLPYATKSLFSNSFSQQIPRYDWDDGFRYSSGVIAFHWSTSKCLSDLNTHNVFMTTRSRSDAEESWSVVRETQDIPLFSTVDEPFNFYVHRASKTDPTAAPEGCDAIMVLVPYATLSRRPSYSLLGRDEAIKKYATQIDKNTVNRIRDAVIHRMGIIKSLKNLRANILDEVVDTPVTYADQYNVAAGTPFALSHGLRQLSIARPGAEQPGVPSNVIFCGASSRPGNGVPLVLVGARLAAEKSIKKLKVMDSGQN